VEKYKRKWQLTYILWKESLNSDGGPVMVVIVW
jgi:hypothetical protein